MNYPIKFYSLLAAGATIAPTVYSQHAVEKKNPAGQPNIIIILTDDMGYSDISTYGGNFVSTPHIDRLAEEGVKFTQYYSAAPISSPSRAGLLTGIYPYQWNIRTYLQSRKGNREANQADFLVSSAPTLPRILQTAGYKTGHFGKWHLGGGRDVDNAPSITDYGYDEYNSTWESPDPDPLLTATDWIWSEKDSIQRWNRTAYFVDKTLDFLKRNQGQPCFVNLWPDDVHTPWIGSIDELKLAPKGEKEEKNFKTVLREFDVQIGRLMDGLRELGIAENTIVIFTSDNGPSPSFRGSRAAGLRGQKGSLFEGGIRMPFIAWNAGVNIPQGKIDETSVITATDLLPSLCRMAGVSLPETYRGSGEDMSAALWGHPKKRTQPVIWAFKSPRDKKGNEAISPGIAVREGDWKLLVNEDGSDMMLFNLKRDLHETTDVKKDNEDVAERLGKVALEWYGDLKLKIEN